MQRALFALFLLGLSGHALRSTDAQMPAHRSIAATGGVSAIPILTWAGRTAGNRAFTEAYLTQPVAMGEVSHHALSAVGTLDLEGLTLRRGELTSGAWGEGYVDRRHPHSYIHEAMIGVETSVRSAAISMFAGRGFVPFGSDDPMSRPFIKYPANHHLAQILERTVAVGAVGVGPLIVEGSTFNGDEPSSPWSAPQWDRFGDSWSARVTWRLRSTLELSYSRAFVTSPESPEGGTFDQWKTHAAARLVSSSGTIDYVLLEWARTDEGQHGIRAFRYDSYLGEGDARLRGVHAALRLEHTARPEEERLADQFRTVHPVTDVSILGVSAWTTVTANVTAPWLSLRALRAAPFVEGSLSYVSHGTPAGLVDLTSLYGNRRLWTLSLGARLGVGHLHERMGRYGVARPRSVMHMEGMKM
jgi:hypothetical protein